MAKKIKKNWLKDFFIDNKGKPYKILGAVALLLGIFVYFLDISNFFSKDNAQSGSTAPTIQNNYGDHNTNVANNQGTINIYHESSSKKSSEDEIIEIVMSENSYISHLKGFIGGKEVLYSHYNDYDNNGSYELFALVGESQNSETMLGEIWFVNQNGAKRVEEDEIHYWNNPKTFLIDNYVFISFEKYYATGTKSYIWGVRNDQPYNPNISGKVHGVYLNNYNEIELIHDTYDGLLTIYDDWKVLPDDEHWSLHTWKPYYFYFDGQNFREYGAIEITEDFLMQYENTAVILEDILSADYNIDKVLLRGNNVIHIGCSQKTYYADYYPDCGATETLYTYRSYRIIDNKLIPEISELQKINGILDNEGYGIYDKAFIPSIATYPDSSKIR